MERIRDLLDRFRTKVNLSVREDPRYGVYVAGVTEEYCTCEADLLGIMAMGAANRATAATGMNEGSSRSHSVFMVTVTQRNLATQSARSGKLFLVDLAGSEMVRKTQASGVQLEEAKTINKSLSALGLVINALTEEKPAHVPYRDSKLTRVLQDSLGGNAKTALLINCSPSSYNANETLSTLRFGSRAKSIMNKPKINEQRSVEELSQLLHKAENAIDMQQSYILALEGQLRQGGGNGVGGSSGDGGGDGAVALQSKVAALTAELAEEREEAGRVTKEAEKLTEILKEKERFLSEAADLLRDAERHTEGLRAQAESAEGGRSKAVDEAAQAYAALQDATTRFEFEASELAVRLETLAAANQKLAAEVDGGESAGAPPLVMLGAAELEGLRDRYGDDAACFIAGREETWARRAAQPGGGAAEAEAARTRLSAELQAASEKTMELEMTVAQLKATQGPEAEKLFSARERASLRMQKKFESLQQRLEQLVAVHRQLLRKYAALELEGQEDKKKIALRDERIVQLETNTRTLAMNMRTQAARHVVELTKLREQVSSVRQEQMDARVEPEYRPAGSATVIRGGAAAPQPAVRAIRGGAQAMR
jgi:kinesin family protein 5